MKDMKLGVIETRFAQIIWDNAPLTTNQLIRLCADELDWKRTTTYTVLKKLCERGLFKTENSLVSTLISKQEFEGIELFLISSDYLDFIPHRILPAN